jgi:hypothetical protein
MGGDEGRHRPFCSPPVPESIGNHAGMEQRDEQSHWSDVRMQNMTGPCGTHSCFGLGRDVVI